MIKLVPLNVSLGCDPEFFFTKNGRVIGSEKVLPLEGLAPDSYRTEYDQTLRTFKPDVIIDGVQAEINVEPCSCREQLASRIGRAFYRIAQHIAANKSIKVDFSQVRKVTKRELESLSDKSRIFGCSPSANTNEGGESRIDVDPAVYRYRSCGGHIHLGTNGNERIDKALRNPEELVPLLDIIVGNTCVLLDRNPLNRERRKVYGRAGEYRTPKHGLEYRTLSNFWLRDYTLMSFVMGLARFAVNVLAQSTKENNYALAFRNAIKTDDVVRAINTNNVRLAYKNFRKIEPIIAETTFSSFIGEREAAYSYFPLHANNLALFHHFVKRGLDHWFVENPMKRWVSIGRDGISSIRDMGWEKFLLRAVQPDLRNYLINNKES